MIINLLVLLAIGCALSADPDVGLDMTQISISKGYISIQQHSVTTEDGYILTLFRIPAPRNQHYTKSDIGKPAVLLQHGLLDSSWAWVANFPSNSLGFLLADQGYDVWFGNSRGNYYSMGHVSFPTNSSEFWDFSWDEMAKYDIPAAVSYILAQTGLQKISYVGHSQGTTQVLAAFGDNEAFSKNINLAVLLAPAAYASHASGLFPILADLDLDEIFMFFGVKEFLPDATILQKIAPELCFFVPEDCEYFFFALVGSSDNLNATRIPVYVSETPAGTSVKNMAHWAQIVRSPVFQHYDYQSPQQNMQHYGTPTPPPYFLSNITVPLAIYYAGEDALADPTDVAILLSALPKTSVVHQLYTPGAAHLDYTWGSDSTIVGIYMDVIGQLNLANNVN